MRKMNCMRAFSWWMSHGFVYMTQLKQRGTEWWSLISP
jgi:hypothetical protein